MKVARYTLLSAMCISLAGLAHAATHSVWSGNISVDTRSLSTGTLVGRLMSGGSPVVGAGIRIECTTHTNSSLGDGKFSLAGIPVAAGYVLEISSPNHKPKRATSVAVASGTNDLGDVSLESVSGATIVRPLAPDLNPPISTVPVAGVAFRYYQLVDPGGVAVPEKPVQVRPVGGSIITQADEWCDPSWRGATLGYSGHDGVVRVMITAPSTTTTYEILVDGQVAKNFVAELAVPEISRVWKQKVGYGVSGNLLCDVKAGESSELKVSRKIRNGVAVEETLSIEREMEASAGLSVPGSKVKGLEIGAMEAGLGAGVRVAVDSSFSFDGPAGTDPNDNAWKLMLAFIDPVTMYGGMFMVLQKQLFNTIEGMLISQMLDSKGSGYGGNLSLFGEGELDVSLFKVALPVFDISMAGFGFGGDAGVELAFGYERDIKTASHVFRLDHQTEKGVHANLLIVAGHYEGIDSESVEVELDDSMQPRNASVEFNSVISRNIGIDATFMNGKNGRMSFAASGDNKAVGHKTRISFLAYEPDHQRLFSEDDSWQSIADAGLGLSVGVPTARRLADTGIDLLVKHGVTAGYEKEFSETESMAVPIGVKIAGWGISIDGEIERGAEAVYEKGRLCTMASGGRTIVRYAPTSVVGIEALGVHGFGIPAETILDLEGQWAVSALPVIDAAWGTLFSAVVFHSPCHLTNGNAVLAFEQGTMATGSVVRLVSAMIDTVGTTNVVDPYLPVFGASNYVFGIGGSYRFESTNAFTGTGQLSIAYSEGHVLGLDESELSLYVQTDDKPGWSLIGGTVDAVSNTVMGSVTQLGTFVVAPPLPAGQLEFQLGTSVLPSDGLSQATLCASNLLLNTGEIATQRWMYTVLPSGVSVVDGDVSTNWPGVQLASSNGVLSMTIRAPAGGNQAVVSVHSVAGNAAGTIGIPLFDDGPPGAVSGMVAQAGQSRIAVWWNPPQDDDVALYRVYYREGVDGPPYDGTAFVEGAGSPVEASATNVLLRGLKKGTNYFVAVAAVDSCGNEGPLSGSTEVTTAEGPPLAPGSVALRLDEDGTNVLSWSLSEDDGYNDRDVVRYDVYRAILPGGVTTVVSQVDAGKGLYIEPSPVLGAGEYLKYLVVAVDSIGSNSAITRANNYLPGGAIDNDGDGMGDAWEQDNGFNPESPADSSGDDDSDGLSNMQEYQYGANPHSSDSDADGMPDKWEADNGLHPGSALGDDGVSGDPDRDGADNWTEYVSCTDPGDPGSALEITGLTPDGGGLRIDWRGGEWATQYLQVRYDLASTVDVWSSIFTNATLPTPVTNFMIDAGATNQTLFYRIKVER